MDTFNIIEYLSGLTSYVFDEAVLKRIAMERGVLEATDYSELDQRTKDLLYADLLFVVYVSPNSSASITRQHGAFSKTIGSQTINDKNGIYNIMVSLYDKWSDSKKDILLSMGGGLDWSE